MQRVDRFLEDAHNENEARDVIANDGIGKAGGRYAHGVSQPGSTVARVNTIQDNEKPVYVQRSQQVYRTGMNNLPMQDAKVERHANRFSQNGRSTEPGHVGEGKGGFTSQTYEHTFAPKNQERASELIRSLADKQAEREAALRRQSNIKSAKKLIDLANAPRN